MKTTVLPSISGTEPSEVDPSERDLPGFGGLSTSAGQLPLRAMDVKVHIVGLVAVIRLRQRFRNPTAQVAEASYVFPLPARGAVTAFSATLGGRQVRGVLHERQVARHLYTQAMTEGRRAGLVEEDRPEVFSARVGNLRPGEEATVELTMVQRLPVEGAEATFRFPLVVAPRYVAGVPLEGISVGDGTASDTDAVPDASRITPPVLIAGCPDPVALSLSVELDPAGLPFSDLSCSLHALAEDLPAATETLAGAVRVTLEPGERLDRDFILRFRIDPSGLASHALAIPDRAEQATHQLDGDGTFLVTVVPPPTKESEPIDVVIVLDRSGSMKGWKVVAARRAAGRILDALGPEDRLAVVAFDDRIECFSPTGEASLAPVLYPSNDSVRYRAVEFLARIEARGGTELDAALSSVIEALARDARPTVVVLVTDGQVADEDRLVATITAAAGSLRLHCVGIDQAVNAGLLERLARAGHGHCELVESEERLDQVMAALHARIRTPALRELHLAGSGVELLPETITPPGSVDAFGGVPLELGGRFRGSGRGELVIRATTADGSDFCEHLTLRPAGDPEIAAVWARQRIRQLEDAYAASGDESVVAELVATSLASGVLSRHTAYLAVDGLEAVPLEGEQLKLIQPVEFPSGWVAGGAGLIGKSHFAPMIASAAPLMPPVLGRAARRGASRTASAAPAQESTLVPAQNASGRSASSDTNDASANASVANGRHDQVRRIVQDVLDNQGGDQLRALELASEVLEVLSLAQRAGIATDCLDEALRQLVIALLVGDRVALSTAAGKVLAALAAPEGAKPFWRRQPSRPSLG